MINFTLYAISNICCHTCSIQSSLYVQGRMKNEIKYNTIQHTSRYTVTSQITSHSIQYRPCSENSPRWSVRAMQFMCMLDHWLEWYKWVLTNFDHDRQWFNTLIPPSHESAAVTIDCISRLSVPVRLALRYTTPDIYCRDRQYEWDGEIRDVKLLI